MATQERKATRRGKARTQKRKSQPRNGQKKDLLKQVISLTGISQKSITQELKGIAEQKNLDLDNLTLDQLRQVAASYLREIMGGVLDRYNAQRNKL